MATDSVTPVTIDNFNKLSKGAKLLLCYIRYYGLDEMQLMVRDPDYKELVDLGWIVEKYSAINGVKNFEIPDKLYEDMIKIEDSILAFFSLEDLEKYKKSKRAYYPWLW